MNKLLQRLGFDLTEDKADSFPTKTKQEIDMDKMIKFAEKMKDLSNKLDSCKSIKDSLLEVDGSECYYTRSYNGGWRCSEYKLKDIGLDMDEFYTWIYTKVKEKEVELKAQLKEYSDGCVKCDLN